MEVEELLDSKDLRYILKEIEEGRLSKEGILDNSKFKQKLYDEFEKNGISYDVMRSLVKSFGEKSCIDKIDIDKVMTTNKDRLNIFFTTLMENGKDDLINEVINNEKYTKYFFENLDKNYSAISDCRSNKVMELIDKVKDKENDIPNIEFLPIGLEAEDKKKVLDGEYGKKLFLATVYSASNDVLQDYIDNNPRALIRFKEINMLHLVKRGIKIPYDITDKKVFFESLKDADIVNFRRNINLINRNSYSLCLNRRLKQYEKSILNDFNPQKGIFNLYDIDFLKLKEISDVEKLLETERDIYLFDPRVRKNFNQYIKLKQKGEHVKEIINKKYNLNIDINEFENIDIENITDDSKIREDLYKMRSIYLEDKNYNEELLRKNFKDISSEKFNELLFDYLFEDTKKNVKINIDEMLRYNSSLDDSKSCLSENEKEVYSKLSNLENLSSNEKFSLYENLKDKNMIGQLYQDFSKLKINSYEDISNSLYKTNEQVQDISLEETVNTGSEVYKLKGKQFYMLVRCLTNPFELLTKRNQSCYSLISGENTNIFGSYERDYVYGYDSLDSKMVLNVFEADSFSNLGVNFTTKPNRIMTKKEVVESSGCYSEINIKNKLIDREKGLYEEKRPSYIVSMNNPTKEQIEESKRLNIPIVVIERERYKTKRIDDIEYEEYDNNIN